MIAGTHPSTRLVRGHIHHQPRLRSCNFLLVVRGNLFFEFFSFPGQMQMQIQIQIPGVRGISGSVVCFQAKYKYAPGVRGHSETALLVGLFVFGAPTYSLLSKCCRDHLGYHRTRLESRRMDGPPGFSSYNIYNNWSKKIFLEANSRSTISTNNWNIIYCIKQHVHIFFENMPKTVNACFQKIYFIIYS